MSEFGKKVAYLRGYISALEEELGGENGKKIVSRLLDIIEEMADSVDELNGRVDYIEDDLDDLDNADDLDELDEIDEDYGFEDEELDESESDLFEIQCTECGEDFTIDYDDIMSDDAIRCPHCDARIELDIDFDDEDNKDWNF